MLKIQLSRKIVINAPAESVFPLVADFSQWNRWSPWILSEPEAKVTVTSPPDQVGSVYAWDGDVVGAGEVEHLRLVQDQAIDEDLRF